MKENKKAVWLCLCVVAIAVVGILVSGRTAVPHGEIPPVLQQQEEDGWLTVEEANRIAPVNGVFGPFWVAYEGSICSAVDYDVTDKTRIKPAGQIYFSAEHSCPAYSVQGEDDLVALVLNGQLAAYRKKLDLSFTHEGTDFEILYTANIETDYTCGERVAEYGNCYIYEAVGADGTRMETAYIVDATELLRTQLPDQFGSCQVFREFYWLAKPVK